MMMMMMIIIITTIVIITITIVIIIIITIIIITKGRDNEDNLMVLGDEEWEDFWGNSEEITSFNGFSCDSSYEDDIGINFSNKERQTWPKTLNTAVMECHFLSRPIDEEGKPIRGYRRRMHNA